MSQTDTYVPGINDAEEIGSHSDLYSRKSADRFSSNGTYVPGASEEQTTETVQRKPAKAGEPVVGFLYSISRKGIGEYWPLHLGANTIGRAASCDIRLMEQSVSERHATISIKQMKSTQTMIGSVQDTGSKNGMFLNDEELDYESHPCKNGDVLTIGSCYQLLLILINAKEYGLSVNPDFKPVIEQPEEPEKPSDRHVDRNRYTDLGTVDLSNDRDFTLPGETKIM